MHGQLGVGRASNGRHNTDNDSAMTSDSLVQESIKSSSSGLRPIAVVGPTGAGKSELGLALAREFDGEVVNVDSMQLYQGMDIGTAKLAPEERGGIPHHQLDVLTVRDTASVAQYQRAAVADVDDILARGKTPIMVGGSMMYAQALLDQWEFPPTKPAVRDKYYERQHRLGTKALHAELAEIDPAAAQIIEENDPRRIVRALEVIELTGKPFRASQPDKTAAYRWNTTVFGLRADPAWYAERIALRTATMFVSGLVDEVRNLIDEGLVADSTAGRAIGYSQVLALLAGELTEEEAEEQTLIATRQYARRQRSWFRRDKRITWLDAAADPYTQALRQLDKR